MKSIFIALLGITCLSIMPCEARVHMNKSHSSKKSYVDPRSIRITKDGIFVLEKGHLVTVRALSHDKGGVYVKKGKGKYPCENCGRTYDWERHSCCIYCGCPHD